MEKRLKDAITGGAASFSEEINKNNISNDTPKSKLTEIDNYIIGDIWNRGFCDISHYLSDGKGSTGESLDIDFTLLQLDNAYKRKKDYDQYIEGLNPNEFSNIKSIWSMLSTETDILYNKIKGKKVVPNDSSYGFDTGKFSQYMTAFGDAVNEVK